MRVLVTAPYVGEIGWELMSWQARVRWCFRRSEFDRLVVIGGAGKAAFYEDMPLDYHEVDLSPLPGCACEDRRVVHDSSGAAIRAPSASEGLALNHQEPLACAPGSEKTGPSGALVPAECIRAAVAVMVEPLVARLRNQGHKVELLWPDYAGTIYPCEPECQTFIRFERDFGEPLPPPWVVLVQRSRSGVGADNWSSQQWRELSDRLGRYGINTSVYPCDSASAIAVACHADLAVGQSTGGLHLASLCGCPQVVWSVGETHLWTPWEITNRQRYETFWNPCGTPVAFHETEDLPTPAQAADWIVGAAARIGRRTGSAITRAGFHNRWRLKDWLVRRVIRRPAFRQWPWPVQRFVRYQLV